MPSNRYTPANSLETPRFSDVRTFMRLPNVRDLENSDAVVVGAPFDTGASFRGPFWPRGDTQRFPPVEALQPFPGRFHLRASFRGGLR